MDPANSNEALHEVQMDINEGADWAIVKPALAYLDIIYRVKQQFKIPTIGYQVSGEYTMLQALCEKTGQNTYDIFLESFLALKRSGADAVISYYSLEIAEKYEK